MKKATQALFICLILLHCMFADNRQNSTEDIIRKVADHVLKDAIEICF